MDKIIIGFSKAKGFMPFSWAIQLIEGTKYSHTYIRFYSEKYNRWLIYQASKGMVNFMNLESFYEHNKVISEFETPITDESQVKLVTYAIDRIGKPYSIKAIIGLFFKHLGLKIPFLFDSEKGYVCSELVGRALKDIFGWDIKDNPDELTPKQIYDIVNQHCEEYNIY